MCCRERQRGERGGRKEREGVDDTKFDLYTPSRSSLADSPLPSTRVVQHGGNRLRLPLFSLFHPPMSSNFTNEQVPQRIYRLYVGILISFMFM